MLKAVDAVSFSINEGETIGLVGERGCGRSTLGRCIVRLNQPTKGTVRFHGKDVELLGMVGLGRDHLSRFPHEFSGGQRQRIGIARALSVNPEFIVCDEPISALDMSVQAQVVNMMKKLQEQLGLTYLYIAHDLSVVKYISDRVIVMYLGCLVEEAASEALYANPLHPYTQALLSAIPRADPRIAEGHQRAMIKGEVPSPINVKDCCRFAERCPRADAGCFVRLPVRREVAPGHWVACHLI